MMERPKNFIHFVPLDHLSSQERLEAAIWGTQTLGSEGIYIWEYKLQGGGKDPIPGFWFKDPEAATAFTLRWA